MNFPRSLSALMCGLLVVIGAAVWAPVGSARDTRSGGNGVASESVSAILAATEQAADSLKSVRVSGEGSDAGKTIGLDLTLQAGVGSEGSITLNGNTVKLVIDDGEVYLNGTAAFWRTGSSEAVAQLLGDKWLKAPSKGSFASFATFGNIGGLFNLLFTSHGTLVKTATATVAGTSAIGLRDTQKGGILYVATTGKPYPLEIVNPGKRAVLSFTNLNAPVKISPPSGAVDLSKLQSGS